MANPKVAPSSVEEMKIPLEDLVSLVEQYIKTTTGRHGIVLTKHNLFFREDEPGEAFVIAKWTNRYND